MNKKAFTLVELLAVITILGIIAAITVPFIMNIVTKARQDAFIESAYSIVKSAQNYRVNAITNHTERTLKIDFSKKENPLEITGTMPTSGILKMDENGKIEFKLYNDQAGICITKNKDESNIKKTDITKENCKI